MPSTYLTLTNKLLDRFNEVNLTSGDFDSARGVHSAAKNYINAGLENLNSHVYMWPFNQTEGTQVLTVGQVLYSWPSDFKVADMRSFYIEKDDSLGVNTTTLKEIVKEQWYEVYRDEDFDNSTDGIRTPQMVWHDSNTQFGVTRAPDKAYTVKYKYYKKFVPLSASTDETTVPSEWDETIIDQAEPHMWRFRTNSEQEQLAMQKAKQSLTNMRNVLVNDDFKVYVNMRNAQYSGGRYFNG
jgi:hypothetical protein